MKAIIFGINGQDGFFLRELLEKLNYEVIGVSRSNSKYIIGNVCDKKFVDELIREHKPNYIFHLASNSTTTHDVIFENHDTITTGTVNILEACFKYSKESRVFLSGSALQFENNGIPIDEHTPFFASSAYAMSRIASVYAGRYYRSKQLKVYIGYFFNHDSPLRSNRHINQRIVSAVKRIAHGSNEILKIGDMDVKKEFNYAGDVVNAIWILVNQDIYFESVIGSGIAYSIKDWIKGCFELIGKNWTDFVTEKEGFISEYQILVSNPKLIVSLGWKPKVDFYKLVDLMMTN